ncbi:MAG TPA: hypothetical protein ENN81_05275 [Phycisphaerales bacterium]|nr:hypothetical protein [Phycisphaerales bacterium]
MISKRIAAVCVGVGVWCAYAGTAGAAVVDMVETFDTRAAADSWTGYHYDDGIAYYPVWTNGGNPYIGTSFGYDGSYLYADAASSDGRFAGDYLAAGATGVAFEVHCDDPDLIDIISLAFFSGYNGLWYYWDFALNDLAWHALEAPLDDPRWYSPTAGAPPMQAWTNVEMIGIEVLGGAPAQRSWIALDNFVLTPEPATAVLLCAGVVFLRRPGHRRV